MAKREYDRHVSLFHTRSWKIPYPRATKDDEWKEEVHSILGYLNGAAGLSYWRGLMDV